MTAPLRPEDDISLKQLHREDAQSIIETALMLPVFFFMILGFIDLCLIIMSMGSANFASRAATRYATIHSVSSYAPATQAGFNNVVLPYMFQYPSSTYNVSTLYYTPGSSTPTNTVGSGVYVTLAVSYTFSVFGHTYTPVSYSSTGCGIVIQ